MSDNEEDYIAPVPPVHVSTNVMMSKKKWDEFQDRLRGAEGELTQWRMNFPLGPGVSADKVQALLDERDRLRKKLDELEGRWLHPRSRVRRAPSGNETGSDLLRRPTGG